MPSEDRRGYHHAMRREVLICAVLFALVLVIYGQTIRFDFVNYDDHRYILQNTQLHDGLSPQALRRVFTTTYFANYTPLTLLTYLVDVELFDLNPAGYHASNVLWHAANTLLLFLVLFRFTGAVYRSAAVALLFAIHPLHVESVAWVSSRKDLVCAFFWLTTLLAYRRFSVDRTIVNYVLVWLGLTLALMAKPMAVTLPFVLLLLDYWPLSHVTIEQNKARHRARLLLEKLPLMATAVLFSIITMRAQDTVSFTAAPLAHRLANGVTSYGAYLADTAWPSGLIPFYPYPEGSIGVLPLAASVLVLVIVSLAAYRVRSSQPYALVGWLWFVGSLVPTLGLLQVGGQAHADRYTYIPHIGLFIALVWTVAHYVGNVEKRRRALVIVPALIATLALVVVATLQTRHWRDSISLYTHTLRISPDNYLANLNMGSALLARGDPADAMAYCETATRLNNRDPKALNNLGAAYLMLEDYDAAVAPLQAALALAPSDIDTLINAAVAQEGLGDFDRARAFSNEALRAHPANAKAKAYSEHLTELLQENRDP